MDRFKSLVKFVKYWLPVVIYAIFIFILSSIPGNVIPYLFFAQDIFLHVIEYSFFALLINRAFKGCYPEINRAKRILWVFILAETYAIFDELHQGFTPGRVASVYDIVFDSLGIFLINIFYT